MPSWKTINAYVEFVRPYNATAVLLIFLIGYYFQPIVQNWKELLYGALLLIFLHSAATVQNDFEDRDIDKANNLGRPLLQTISLQQAKQFMVILFLAAFAISLWNLSLNRIFVPLSILLIWLYNAKPFYFSRRPVLSIITLGMISTVAPLVYGFLIGGHTFSIFAALWIFSWFLLRISITLLKDYKDEKGDKLFHKQTFYLTYGRKITAVTSIILAIIGYGSLFLTSYFLKQNSLLLVIPFVVALFCVIPRFALLNINTMQEANKIFHNILVKENRFELVYLLWIIFSR